MKYFISFSFIKGFIWGMVVCILMMILPIRTLVEDKYKSFVRGMDLGIDYKIKYQEYPSYWIWNEVYYHPNANIDSLRIVNDNLSKEETEQFKSERQREIMADTSVFPINIDSAKY